MSSIAGYSFFHPVQNLTNLDLKFDGSLYDLPGGPLKGAVGVDYQHVYRASNSGGTTTGPSVDDLVDVHYPNFSRQVESLFAELYVPIIGSANSLPGVRSLLFDIAGRYDHYRDITGAITDPTAPLAGSRQSYGTTNPKFSFTWSPADGLKVRGSYGKSFRAPVSGDYVYGAPTLGIPVTVTPAVASLLNLPAHCASAPGSCFQIFNQGGDSAVKPETAKTYSIGFDLNPVDLPGLAVSLTYYKINYDNQIVVPATGPWQTDPAYATALVNAGLLTPNPALGSFGTYNPATVRGMLSYGNGNSNNPATQFAPYTGLPGYLFANGILPVAVTVNGLNSNAGQLRTQGFDYALNYNWTTDWGNWVVGDSGTIVTTYKQALAAGTPLVSYLNKINNPMHFQTRAHLGWNMSSFVANGYVNYVNAYENPGVGTVGSLTTMDLAVSYTVQTKSRWLNDLRFALQGQNIFNRLPPATLNISNQIGYDSQEASVIGRLLSFTVSKSF